jgi:crotonobetainyl-CoA:carnitine CoA-transferase CaiB-like acyl-CoA transferase
MMATAVLGAIIARNRTGKGQFIDFSCTEAGIGLAGPELLDSMVNQRPMRRAGKPNSNADNLPVMAPHGIYTAAGEDSWVAIACRNDEDWAQLAKLIDEDWTRAPVLATLSGRLQCRDEIDRHLQTWTRARERKQIELELRRAGIPVSQVAMPEDRIENDPRTSSWGLWPNVHHDEIGETRVEGVPIHLSETDWSISRGAPCLGADNDFVFGSILGMSPNEIEDLKTRRII